MPLDYNPDREGHVDHKWAVIKATKRPVNVELDGQQMKFGKDGAFSVSDPGKAAALRQKYGNSGDVTVTRMRTPQPISDRGHRYFFGAWPEMPWKRGKDGSEKENDTQKEDDGTQEYSGKEHEVGRRGAVRRLEEKDR